MAEGDLKAKICVCHAVVPVANDYEDGNPFLDRVPGRLNGLNGVFPPHYRAKNPLRPVASEVRRGDRP